MVKKLLISIFVLLFLVPAVLGVGTCSVDKTMYHPGETAEFSCSCTSPAEENRAGFIVWQNDTVILQSVAVSSGSCVTSFFDGSYLFLSGANYSGNVTFSLNADGTGIPLSWDDASDVHSDSWNVSGASALNCLIYNISGKSHVLGNLGSVKISVKDAITGNPLVHVSCQAEGYDISNRPILFEPYGVGHTDRLTGSGGEVGFQHLMVEDVWSVDTSYLYEFHCHCLNTTDESCYDETTGLDVGFKSCTSQALFTTSHDDYRNDGTNFLPIILGFLIIIAYLVFMGVTAFNMAKFDMNKTMFWISLISFGLAMLEVIFLAGIIYINNQGLNLTSLLKINFYSFALLGFGIGTITLSMILLKAFDTEDGNKGVGKW